jgi:hypothetical protein
MTHEELKELGFKKLEGKRYYYITIGHLKYAYDLEYESFELNECFNFIPLGSNFTPESLKQLINILKKSQ